MKKSKAMEVNFVKINDQVEILKHFYDEEKDALKIKNEQSKLATDNLLLDLHCLQENITNLYQSLNDIKDFLKNGKNQASDKLNETLLQINAIHKTVLTLSKLFEKGEFYFNSNFDWIIQMDNGKLKRYIM